MSDGSNSAATAAATPSRPQARLTLDNLLVPEQSVTLPPSVALHGLQQSCEIRLRNFACALIQHSSVLLELPQVVTSPAAAVTPCPYGNSLFVFI
ncbi:MAG: Cyclin-L2 [Marteilia pararefringens]